MAPPAPLAVPVLDSEGNTTVLRGYYALTEVFIPNSWNCPNFPISHSLNEEDDTRIISWCGAEWVPVDQLEKAAKSRSGICLSCVKAYEDFHYGN